MTVVADHDDPHVRDPVGGHAATDRPARHLPTMLRIQVGPITWDLADAAAYTSLLNAWRGAADLLAAASGEVD